MTVEKHDIAILALGLMSVLAAGVLPEEPSVRAAPARQTEGQERARLVAAHQNTSFPLTGKHIQVECRACHQNGVVAGTPETCEFCHWARRQDDPYRLQLGSRCGDCHTPQDWSRIQTGAWEHEQVTGFRLEGRHQALDCTECHGTRSFRETTAECSECHRADFERAKEPDHLAANFPTDCELCHFSASTFRGARFEHTVFPLSGGHRSVSCEGCHANGRFAGTPTDCVSCHRSDFQSTSSPNHVAAGFSTDCETCHGSGATGWIGARFDHDTVFPLTGSHKSSECTDCHRNGTFAGTSSNCVDCHRADYERTRNPNHLQAGFPTDCAACHGASATTWRTASFDHDAVFRLRGMHKTLECSECHVNGRFSGTASECVDCHRLEYDGTKNPNHREAGFSTNCVACHGEGATGWAGARFDHNRVFQLRGRHRAAECTACHVNGRFVGTPKECIACHRTDYSQTTNPNHAATGFGTDCASCHGEAATTWTGADFNHNQFFQLKGRHRAVDCTQCHVNGRFAGTPTNCVQCHRQDYDRAKSPNHAQSGFSTNCTSCHGDAATTWAGASFNHDQFFQLKGRHRAVDCAQCHVNGRFAGTPTDCVQCHRQDYDRTTNPNHAQSGFGTNCASCHGDAATTWTGASFNHAQFFQLRGKHKAADCTQCHVNGRFAGTPTDCVACHQPDYDRTRNPNHAQAGFGTNCASCHGNAATTWTGASFNHDQFFRLEGAHRNLDCQLCHAAGFNLPRDCVGCHRDDYNSGPTRNSTAPTVTSRRRCSSSPARPAMSTSGPKWTKNTRTSAGIRTTAGRATRAIRTAGAESLLVGCQCSAHRLQKISLMVRRFDACSRHVKRGCGSPP